MTSDGLTRKKFIFHLDRKSLALYRAGPTDNDEKTELTELAEHGLIKVEVIDTSASFVTDKSMLQKLLEDFSLSDGLISVIADRSQGSNSLVQIHATQIWLRKYGVSPAQYRQHMCEEDAMLEEYKNMKKK